MASCPGLSELIADLEGLHQKALNGELTGFMLVAVRPNGDKEVHVGGDFANESPAVLASTRATLIELAEGKTPGEGEPKH